MELLDTMDLMQQYAKKASKFCMYISWQDDVPFEELIRAAPYLKEYEVEFLRSSNSVVLTFDTAEEMEHCFVQTVGDDGPTILNNYIGPVRVYALTCSNEGELWNENT